MSNKNKAKVESGKMMNSGTFSFEATPSGGMLVRNSQAEGTFLVAIEPTMNLLDGSEGLERVDLTNVPSITLSAAFIPRRPVEDVQLKPESRERKKPGPKKGPRKKADKSV